jgi:hypothetical protein
MLEMDVGINQSWDNGFAYQIMESARFFVLRYEGTSVANLQYSPTLDYHR